MYSHEVLATRSEVEAFLATLDEEKWTFLRILARENITSTMKQLEEVRGQPLFVTA